MTHFPAFARMVADSFQDIAKGSAVFVADLDGDALWVEYLAAFPEGTDPIFKRRTWHDCSCCKQFIRRAGCVLDLGPARFNPSCGLEEVESSFERAQRTAMQIRPSDLRRHETGIRPPAPEVVGVPLPTIELRRPRGPNLSRREQRRRQMEHGRKR